MNIVLNSFGSSIKRDNNGFVITNPDGTMRVPVSGVKSIQVGLGTTITSDAAMLAIENEIEVLFVNKSGQPAGRIWSSRYGSISTIRKGQLAFSQSKEAVSWLKKNIRQKIANQQALILLFDDPQDMRLHNLSKTAIKRLDDYREKIQSLGGDSPADIAATTRGWEGNASRIYFEMMNEFLPEEYRFKGRSQRPALDVANAMLNYGYGILYGKVESALIKAGADPCIGMMHRDEYNRPVLVYDLIEIYRVWVDYIVFSILRQKAITEEHYSVKEDGSYWMEPLGRRIMIQSMNDYLEEVIEQNGMQRSRGTQILLSAQNLAQKFKSYCNE